MRFGFERVLSTTARLGGLATLVLVPATRAAATPVSFDEAVSGNPISVRTVMDAGPGGAEHDRFAFTLPSGTQRTGITVSLSTSMDPDAVFAELRYGLSPRNVSTVPADIVRRRR
jgi:hypothetical protein